MEGVVKRLGRFIEGLANGFGYLSGWLVPLMMLLVVFEVFMRYALNRPPAIADEFSAYMLVALSYLGAAYTLKEKGHVRITALVSRLPTRVSSWLRLITLVIALVFALGLSVAAYGYIVFSFKMGMKSWSWISFPLQGPQMTVVIGFILLSLVFMVKIVKAVINIRSGTSVEGRGR